MARWLHGDKLPAIATSEGAFLFLVGTILNQNISGEQAWRGVARLSERLEMHPVQIARRDRVEIESAIRQAPAVHPFATVMSRAILSAAQQVCRDYRGDARLIWRTSTGSREVARRLVGFRQIGQHKAAVATFLLATVYGEQEVSNVSAVGKICPAVLKYVGAT
jgi:uncharacterized HhH-GPD family protein